MAFERVTVDPDRMGGVPCLSPRVAEGLCALGHDATHAGDHGLHGAADEAVLAMALAEARVVLSADSDFGTILARTRAAAPSVILIRRAPGRRVEEPVALSRGGGGRTSPGPCRGGRRG